jgi:hypothetical protein
MGKFTGYGDSEAIDEKVKGISDAWIRMSETRAIVRALRWYTNNAVVAEEEILKTSEPKTYSKSEIKSLQRDIINLIKSNPDESFCVEDISKLLFVDLQEIKKEMRYLFEEGIIFEPKPGYFKIL